MDDYANNSIRESQIAVFYTNDEDEELNVKTLIISRSLESAGEFEYEFKEAQNYKINLQIPNIFTQHKVEDELDINLAAYLDGHFFFVISHSEIIADHAIFQKYKIDKELNELNFV